MGSTGSRRASVRIPALMIQGTGSNTGKSTLVAALCRAFVRRGLRVAPFKPQNMSNNAAATDDGGEIGRAQAVQARACRLASSVHMNPVLLKPETETGAQVIVQGRRAFTLRARDYGSRKAQLLPAVIESFAKLGEGMDLVLVEGAGSPAETNLRAGDIANMGFAEAADVPVVLVGDIDRGGVIASLVGTHAVLEEADRRRIAAFAINKFRGDASLFEPGARAVVEHTGWPCLGILPFLPAALRLPAEDALDLSRPPAAGEGRRLRIVVPILARIANFDDLDPLRQEPGVDLVLVPPGQALPGDADLVVLPGSKSTIGDLAILRAQGWDVDIAAHRRRGGHVLGLCGGYQMLGCSIADPEGIEGPPGTVPGLGLLEVETVLTPDKVTAPAHARHRASGLSVSGYEIHLGRTDGPDCTRPLLDIAEGAGWRADGAASPDGRVQGCYVHGLFASDGFRAAYLSGFRTASTLAYEAGIEAALDELADAVEGHLDLDAMLAIARGR
ncbi:cobyric acid synthase [Enterovirga rhinocerotis]|uniref:Cobyric acid synthase n=1 Tax=Enterovirga rhinocerotis TaxID=1339210 RepID=A0A4V3DYZ7_9HYPH|nr:cobyric acid synthase [Enterovirga rhinocerotis]TDR94569.1 adenosylcobyric acid synthase (glutamine-hydrolysing) [Enterovirga rhinocerotis]